MKYRTVNYKKLDKILTDHKHWLNNEGGKRAHLEHTDSPFAELPNANLKRANLFRANLTRSVLSGADLSNANLSEAYLSIADLSSANLSSANLNRADLSGANLRKADLSSANLSSADLSRANLNRAYLSGADLNRADLSGANLNGASLNGVELSGAHMDRADLREANLSGAKGILSPIKYMESTFERTDDGYIVYKTFGSNYKTPVEWDIKIGSIIEEVVNPNRTDRCGCGINVAPLEWVKSNYDAPIYKLLIKWEWLPGVVVPYHTDGKIRCEKAMIIDVVTDK